MKRKIIISILALLVVIQFFRIDKSTPVTDPSSDFLTAMDVPDDIKAVINTRCYDCHSYNSTYPWYAEIAPVSWWLKHHINEAREHLNFSEWTSYSPKKANHKLEECYEEVKEGEMPLESYTWMHSEAILSVQERKKLAAYFQILYKKTKIDGIEEE